MTNELNFGRVITAIASKVPDRPAVLQGNSVLTFGDLVDQSTRLARLLHDRGLGPFAERSQLGGHQAGQHMLAQYLDNGPAYVEGLVGSFLARVAPFNVNHRYQTDELSYLFQDAAPAVIQYHARFAPMLERVLPTLSGVQLLLQVDDGSGQRLLPGALDYDEALASTKPKVDAKPSPDDLYVLYTGGTTGMPKGVLWRQGDSAVATLGLLNRRANREWSSVEESMEAIRPEPTRTLPCSPMMHGAAQWAALTALGEGNAVVFPEQPETFSAAGILTAIERHRVQVITIIGDAFGWPLVEELSHNDYDLSSLKAIYSGGASLHPSCKEQLLQLIPGARIVDTIGSSESGRLGSQQTESAAGSAKTTFVGDDSTAVIAEDLSRLLTPGHEGVGWLARFGRIPLGYLGDPVKTAKTFPVIDGVRYCIPGDRARLLADGQIQMLGRDSLTINTGGEKVFVEEVEAVLKDHARVVDAVVCGRPSLRWGSEVAAVVVSPEGVDLDVLLIFCRARLARYKVPKSIRFVNHIPRSAAGKPDYRWATQQFQQSAYRAESLTPSSLAAIGDPEKRTFHI